MRQPIVRLAYFVTIAAAGLVCGFIGYPVGDGNWVHGVPAPVYAVERLDDGGSAFFVGALSLPCLLFDVACGCLAMRYYLRRKVARSQDRRQQGAQSDVLTAPDSTAAGSPRPSSACRG